MTDDELFALADGLAARHDHAVRRLAEEEAALAAAEQSVLNVSSAQNIILSVAQTMQQKAHGHISGVVTRCLRAVFDDPYEFEIVFERKRGRTEARLVFRKRGHEVDPTEEGGGGVVDVAAFALRVACLVLTRPPLRRLLVFDEPFKHLNGSEMQERAAAVLLALADELDVQFIIAADDDWLKIGRVVEL